MKARTIVLKKGRCCVWGLHPMETFPTDKMHPIGTILNPLKPDVWERLVLPGGALRATPWISMKECPENKTL